MSNHLYILNGRGEPVLEPDLHKWALWMENIESRKVGRDYAGQAVISTVFLGVDYSLGGSPPILWESMVFGGPLDQSINRCAGSREQALAMHQSMLAQVQQNLPKST